MLERFSDPNGRERALTALKDQSIIGGQTDLAESLLERAQVTQFPPGSVIIEESNADDHLCFILAGSVSIRVAGREVAKRVAGQHIGEMAALDPGKPRSASVVAIDDVVVTQISATAFASIANANPQVWRNVARDLADRLRQRNRFVSSKNSKPVLFVGSSTEASQVAAEIREGLKAAPVEVKVWTDSFFTPSKFPIESLEHALTSCDFAALVISPDDQVVSRNAMESAPRDNVVFELGLFIGALGHERVFLVYPRDVPIKIPSDLLGLTVLRYDPNKSQPPSPIATQVCEELRDLMDSAGPR